MGPAFKILLVEDSADDVFLLQRAFNKAAAADQFSAVKNGLEAISYLKGEGTYNRRDLYPFPDLVLLDLNMPIMNGFEVLEWVRHDSECRRLIVHVLTASSRADDVQRAYSLGANGYIMKPTRLDELVDFVNALHHWHRFVCLPLKPGEKASGKDECLSPVKVVSVDVQESSEG